MEIFLVGGAVRDQLLGYPYHEKDWVVVACTPEKMASLGYMPVGKDFPVFLHPTTHEEYALARTERKTAPGYKGFTFHADGTVSLEEDLQRRDLTINAIAQDSNGTIIDPYNGQQDIKERRLRHTSPAFTEDPVRVLRVARFAARYHHLGFTVADETLTLMQKMVQNGETKHLVAERVWQECHKALAEKHPERFFTVLIQCDAIHDIFSYDDTYTETETKTKTKNSTDHKNEKILQGVSLLSFSKHISENTLIRFSTFCYPLDEKNIQSLCQHLAIPNEYRELIVLSQRYYLTCISASEWTAISLCNLFQKTDALRKPERFQQLLLACQCIFQHSHQDKTFTQGTLLMGALDGFKDVNHQALIEQGYQKAALGKAIQEKRIEAVASWLTQTQQT